MKSVLIAVLSWIAAFLGIEYVFEHVYSFDTWLGRSKAVLLGVEEQHGADGAAFVASLFFAFAVGAFLMARFEGGEEVIIARSEGPPIDGKLVAIAGTVEALGEPLVAPFSGQTCLAYDYDVQHRNSLKEANAGLVMDRNGLALAPCAIRSGVRLITLLAFPGLESFPKSATDEARAKRFIASTKFEETGVLDSLSRLGEVATILDTQGGAVRKDWQLTSYDVANQMSYFTERILRPDEKVTVIGRYSASKNAILPEPNSSGIRMFRGTRQEALAAVRDSRKYNLIGAGCLLGLSALIAAGFIFYRQL